MDSDTITTMIMPDQAGIIKELIDTQATGSNMIDGIIITAINHQHITNISFTPALETGIKRLFTADTNMPPKNISIASLSNSEIAFQGIVFVIPDLSGGLASPGKVVIQQFPEYTFSEFSRMLRLK